jgi:hypothetical protein
MHRVVYAKNPVHRSAQPDGWRIGTKHENRATALFLDARLCSDAAAQTPGASTTQPLRKYELQAIGAWLKDRDRRPI